MPFLNGLLIHFRWKPYIFAIHLNSFESSSEMYDEICWWTADTFQPSPFFPLLTGLCWKQSGNPLVSCGWMWASCAIKQPGGRNGYRGLAKLSNAPGSGCGLWEGSPLLLVSIERYFNTNTLYENMRDGWSESCRFSVRHCSWRNV